MAKLSQQTQRGNATNKSTSSIVINSSSVHVKVKRTRNTVPRDSPLQRSSIYRGVTRHRWTGRYEAHLWDKNYWNESQTKKGRQVYLGAYDDETIAAHAYDLAALKYWGRETILNFPVSTYEKELQEMGSQSREEYIGSLRRKSSGFSRGVSKYRGVARHHHNGRWEARIGRVFGNKYLYLGTYATQEEAAVAYDMAAIEYRGLNAVTNFDLSRYIKWLKPDTDNSTSTTGYNPNPKVETTTSPTQKLHHKQPPPTTTSMVMRTTLISPPQSTTTTSALGLLLQSSKFKEMMEMTSAAEYTVTPPESDSSSSSPSSYNNNNNNNNEQLPDDNDINYTYFEAQDFGPHAAAGNDFIFGHDDFNSLMQPMLHGDRF